MSAVSRKITYSIPFNLMLLTIGVFMLAFGIKAIIIPRGLITGGISGLGLLLFYTVGHLSPGIWYLMLNIPIFLLGWIYVSRRFFFYSLYGMGLLTLFIDLIPFQVHLSEPILSVLAGGSVAGAGLGICLRSLGSSGGTDIIGVVLNQKFNVRIGKFYFLFNLVLFTFSLWFLSVESVIYSLALTFISSAVVDYFLSMFNERKMAIIISDESDAIAAEIMNRLNRGITYLYGRGGYSGKRKKVMLTVVNNYQLKRLEEVVFNIDSEAFLITDSTFNVLGKGFSSRKVY